MRCLVLMLLLLAKTRGQNSTPSAVPSTSEAPPKITVPPIMNTALPIEVTQTSNITSTTMAANTISTTPTAVSLTYSPTPTSPIPVSTTNPTTPLLNTILQDFQNQEQSFQNLGEKLGQDVNSQQQQLKKVGQQIGQQVQSADQAYLNAGEQIEQQVMGQEQQIQNVSDQLIQDAKAQGQALQHVSEEVSQEVHSQEQAYQNAEEKLQQKAPLIPSSQYPSSNQPQTLFGLPTTALGGLSLLGSSPQLQSLWQLAASRGIPVLSGLNLGL